MPVYPEVRSSLLPPKEPSVLDSYRDQVLRVLARWVGADDPGGSMMGAAMPLTAIAKVPKMVRVYRGEPKNPVKPVRPTTQFRRWFTDDIEVAKRYANDEPRLYVDGTEPTGRVKSVNVPDYIIDRGKTFRDDKHFTIPKRYAKRAQEFIRERIVAQLGETPK